MKRFVPILFVFCTVLAVAAGFLLPGFVSAMQDRGLQAKVNTYETDSLQFHAVAQITDSLRLLAGGYTKVKLERGSSLDAEGAYQAALDALQFLIKQDAIGILPEGYPNHSETPFLAVSSDQSMSAVLWRCELYSNSTGKWINMLIDDNTGKMLAFGIVPDQEVISGQAEKSVREQASDFCNRLASTCARYYGWEAKDVQLDDAVHLDDASNYLIKSDLQNSSYRIMYSDSSPGYSIKGSVTMITDSGESLTFPLTIIGNLYAFNSTSILEN